MTLRYGAVVAVVAVAIFGAVPASNASMVTLDA